MVPLWRSCGGVAVLPVQDNVTILIDGVLYVKVMDPVRASYGVDNALYAVSQLAQVRARWEGGRIDVLVT